MSCSRHAGMLLARCGRVLWPSVTARRVVVNSRPTTQFRSRSFSDQNNDHQRKSEDLIKFPELPISPMKHFMQCAKSFAAFSDAAINLDFEQDSLGELQEATKEVIAFVSERLSVEEYDDVKDRFTPSALSSIKSVVSSLPAEDKGFVLYDPDRSSIFDHIYPWGLRDIYYDNRSNIEVTFCLLQVLLNGTQIVWGVSMLMPEHGGSSEEWKISHLHFSLAKP